MALTNNSNIAEIRQGIQQLPGDEVARHGKVLQTFNAHEWLILHSSNGGNDDESIVFDCIHQTIQEKIIPYSTSDSQYIGLFRGRFLYALDYEGKRGWNIQDNELIISNTTNNPTFSQLAKKSQGCTILHDPIPTTTGGIYIIGGRDKQSNKIRKDVHYFYMGARGEASESWTKLPPMTIARKDAAAVLIVDNDGDNSSNNSNRRIVVMGGFCWDRQSFRYQACPYTEILSVHGHGWSEGPSLTVPRQNHCAVVIGDGKFIVVIGGIDSYNEPMDTIEVWNTRETNGFCVLPITGFLDGRGAIFQAIAHPPGSIYLIGGATTRIDVIRFDLQALADYTVANAPASNTATADSSTPSQDDDRKIKAKTPPLSPFPSNKSSTDVSQPSWLPNPPTVPSPPTGTTLHERHKAMVQYIQALEAIQTTYQQTMETSSQKCTDYYNTLCSKQLDLIQFHGNLFLKDTQQLIEQAQDDLKLQEKVLSRQYSGATGDNGTAAFASSRKMTNFLQQNDKDEFDDDIPSQLRCPLTLDIMTDPVVAADGNTYEKAALEGWFRNSRLQHEEQVRRHQHNQIFVPRSPLTGAQLATEDFFPVHTLRSMCLEFTKQQPHENM